MTNKKGLMVVLSSPSGGGKSTIANLLIENDKDTILSISATTRPQRQNEMEGKHYFFKNTDEFASMVRRNEFLEHAEVFGYMYGTPKEFVYNQLEIGNDVIFDVDWQGANLLQENTDEKIITIFILPPSIKELKKRLKSRSRDDEETIKYRMERAKSEISHWNEYEYVLVNDDLKKTLEQVMNILKAERIKQNVPHDLIETLK